MLEIKNLHARVAAPGGREILKGVNLTIDTGEVHAIMGKNGSGKSTLCQVLAGRDTYEVTEGSVTYLGQDLLAMKPEERAHLGVFLAFQYRHPTLPSRLIPSSRCASTANSMGSSRKTSLQNPLTIMFTASSSAIPRLLQ